MNQKARDLLRKAWLDGTPQIKNQYVTEQGRCGLGVLGFTKNLSDQQWKKKEAEYDIAHITPDGAGLICPICAVSVRNEVSLLAHYNDADGLDFGKLAEAFYGEISA